MHNRADQLWTENSKTVKPKWTVSLGKLIISDVRYTDREATNTTSKWQSVQKSKNILCSPVSQDVPHLARLQLPMQKASSAGTSETFPFSPLRTFSIIWLPLGFCQTPMMVADSFAIASSDYVAFACSRLWGLHLFLHLGVAYIVLSPILKIWDYFYQYILYDS